MTRRSCRSKEPSMPEFRQDPLTGRRVIMAPERSERPMQVAAAQTLAIDALDPFAEGREFETTPEVLAYRAADSAPDGPGWRVRVVSNKYPALCCSGDTAPRTTGLYQSSDAVGVHDVIVECPQRESSLARLSAEQVGEVLRAYRDRLAMLREDRRLQYATIFKNHGARAGASLPHSHSQLMALTLIPDAVSSMRARALQYAEQHGRSLFDALIEQELADEVRVVLQSPGFLVFCPYASRFGFETWILPTQPDCHYAELLPGRLAELSVLLRTVLRKLDVALQDPPYNFVLQTAPLQQGDRRQDRWRIEIYPRLTGVAGFEWATDCFVNAVLPETAAGLLRATDIPGAE